MKKLVIFDLDGTLLYTLEDINKSLNIVLEKHGYRAVSVDKTKNMVGYGAKKLIELASNESGEKLDSLFAELKAVMSSSDNSLTTLYNGLDKVLISLKNKGYKLAIISNKPNEATQEIYKQKLSEYKFDYVSGANANLFKVKPDKECVEYCLNLLNVDKKDAVYVGDSEVDVQTAINANIDCISVLWGYRSRQEISKAGKSNFVSTPNELLDMIEKI